MGAVVNCVSSSAHGIAARHLVRVGRENRGVSVLASCSCAVTRVISNTKMSIVLIKSSTSGMVTNGIAALPVALSRVVCRNGSIIHNIGHTVIVISVPFNSCRNGRLRKLTSTVHVVGRDRTSTLGLRKNRRVVNAIGHVLDTNVPVVKRLKLVPRSVGGCKACAIHTGSSTRTRGLMHSTRLLRRTKYFKLMLRGVPTTLTTHITDRLAVPIVNVNTNNSISNRILIIRSVLNVGGNFHPHFLHHCTSLRAIVASTVDHCISSIGGLSFPGRGRRCWRARSARFLTSICNGSITIRVHLCTFPFTSFYSKETIKYFHQTNKRRISNLYNNRIYYQSFPYLSNQ